MSSDGQKQAFKPYKSKAGQNMPELEVAMSAPNASGANQPASSANSSVGARSNENRRRPPALPAAREKGGQKDQHESGLALLQSLSQQKQNSLRLWIKDEYKLLTALSLLDALTRRTSKSYGDSEIQTLNGILSLMNVHGIPDMWSATDVVKLIGTIDPDLEPDLRRCVRVEEPAAGATTVIARIGPFRPTKKLIDFVVGNTDRQDVQVPRELYFSVTHGVETQLVGIEIRDGEDLRIALRILSTTINDERLAEKIISEDFAQQMNASPLIGQIRGVRIISTRLEKVQAAGGAASKQGKRKVIQLPWYEGRVIIMLREAGQVEYLKREAKRLTFLGMPIRYKDWVPRNSIRVRQEEILKEYELQAIKTASQAKPPLLTMTMVQSRMDMTFKAGARLPSASLLEVETAIMEHFGGQTRGILSVNVESSADGKALWWAPVSIFVGDVEADAKNFLALLLSSLASGKGPGTSKFESIKGKSESPEMIEYTYRNGTLQPPTQALPSVDLVSKLEQIFLESDEGFFLPAKDDRGRDIVWETVEDEIATPLESLKGPDIMRLDHGGRNGGKPIDLREVEALSGCAAEAVYHALMQMDESGIITMYPHNIDSVPVILMRHSLNDSDHRRARQGGIA